jgi:hypothetical protein
MTIQREIVPGKTIRLIALLAFLSVGLLLASSLACQAANYAVSISVTATKFVDVGNLVTHVFTLTNQGILDDVYALELTLPQGWIALPVPATLSVQAGGTGIVFVNLLVLPTAEAGTYEIALKATSLHDSAIHSQETAYVQVRSSWGFELKWVRIPPRGQPGERLQGSLKVTNTGNSPDEYQVDIVASAGWEAGVMFPEFGLLPGESREVEFYVLVPNTATAKAQYGVTLTVTSIQNPSLTRTLSTTGRLSPPPPELVGGTLFPEWMMSVDFDIDQRAIPRLNVRGWGDIEGFGKIDAGAGLTMAGIEGARAWIDTGDWSIFLDGGTIVGPFLGVSGRPLFGGHVGELGLWRLLFTEDSKGFYGLLRNDTSALRFSLGSDSVRELAFQQVDLRHDFAGPASGRFLIGRGVQTESGIVWSLGGDVILEEWEFGGSFMSVGSGYPNQSPRTEWQVDGSYDGCPFPVDSSWSSVSREAGLPPDEYNLTAHNFRASAPVVSLDVFSCGLSVQFGMQQSDDVPRSIDELNYSVGLSLAGNTPVPWSFSTASQWLNDKVAGTTTTSQQVAVGGEVEFGEISTVSSLSIQVLQGATGTTTSSGLSVTLSDDNLPGSPEVTFSAGGGEAAAEMELSWTPAPDTEVTWVWELSFCGEAEFSTDISVRFPAVFPFCGPTKGRISGRVIVDANGNSIWDSGEEGVEGVLLLVDGIEAITGQDGLFIFPPLDPGTYELAIKDLLAGLVPEMIFPMEISISAGDEPSILIPLRPQSWLRVRVFSDVNQNGQRETAERGASGVRVFVKGGEFEKEMRTDAGGRFIMEISPGTYAVTLDVESLPERTEATSPETVSVSMPEYGTVDVEFGIYQRPRPVVITFGPPTASFDFTPQTPIVGETVRFTGISSQAVNAEIVSYAWEFRQDDVRIKLNGEETDIVFAKPGLWQVYLTVTDSNGLRGAAKKEITVGKDGG